MKFSLLIFLSCVLAQNNGTETTNAVTTNNVPKTTTNNIPQTTNNAQTNTKNQQTATLTNSGGAATSGSSDGSGSTNAPMPSDGATQKQEVSSSVGVPVLTSIICAVALVCAVIGIFIVRKFGLAPSSDFKDRLKRQDSEPSVQGTPVVAIHSPKDLDYQSHYAPSEASYNSGRNSPYAPRKSPVYDDRRPSNDYYARSDYNANNSETYQQNPQYYPPQKYPQQQRPSFDSSRYDQRRPSNPESAYGRPPPEMFDQRRPSNPEVYGRPVYEAPRPRYNGY
ncbi:hypothetical protein HDV04_002217 [Boothiomyces sp. JEL0838]|nr:hypothetical protein HDV04_002217 [Boothiomyces sp. JEL0838]